MRFHQALKNEKLSINLSIDYQITLLLILLMLFIVILIYIKNLIFISLKRFFIFSIKISLDSIIKCLIKILKSK